jgi:hypothetical protein
VKKIILMGVICFSLVLLINSAIAEKTVKTIEGQLGFIQQPSANEIYEHNLNIQIPDGVSEIIDIQIIIKGDFPANTVFSTLLNNEFCYPNLWTTPDTYSFNYEGIFDCSNVANDYKGGQISMAFGTSSASKNVKGTYKITYKNNPEVDLEKIYKNIKADISVGATDYFIGETATIFAKLTCDSGCLSDAHCDYIVFNSSKAQIHSGRLEYVPSSRGLYIANLTVPSKVGVYPVDVQCVRMYNDTTQIHYFKDCSCGESLRLRLRNSTSGTDGSTINITDVGQQTFSCFSNFFESEVADFGDYVFIENITDTFMFVQKSGIGSTEFINQLNFYLKSEFGRFKIGTLENTSRIYASSPIRVNFQTLVLSQPMFPDAVLEVEWCARKETIGKNDLYFWFNNTLSNASFVLNTLSVNDSISFFIGGSSEIHVMPNISIGNISVNLTSIENLIKDVLDNQTTISNKLDSMQTDIDNILVNQSNLKQIIYDTNQSLYDKILEIKTDISTLQSYVISVNDTVLQTNQTIMTKLYGIQEELANITNLTETAIDLIFDTNQTIMSYLFEMNYTLWQSIYDVRNNLNFTNVTLTITANLTGLPKETYLYFQTVEETLQHNNDTCIANGTIHRKEILVEKCVAGDCFNVTKQIDEYCQYGCNQGQCNPEPQTRFSLMIVAILLMLGFSYGIYQVARRT